MPGEKWDYLILCPVGDARPFDQLEKYLHLPVTRPRVWEITNLRPAYKSITENATRNVIIGLHDQVDLAIAIRIVMSNEAYFKPGLWTVLDIICLQECQAGYHVPMSII